jgi:formiminotetrahydrofolate cyclodeaminase
MAVDSDDSARQPLGDLLAALAARTPAPGGGSAAAWGLALSAALVEMACSFTLARAGYEDRHERMRAIATRARELRAAALEHAERELHAYGGVIEALQLPDGDPERPQRIAAANSAAADSPLGIARDGAELAALAAEVARVGNPNLIGDALTGALLAEAACRAAANLVKINLADAPADPRLAESEAITEDAFGARAAALDASGG